MSEENATNDAVVDAVVEQPAAESPFTNIDVDPPAPDADAKKSEAPVPDADDQKPVEETAEQQEERKQSRRARAREREAAALASAQTEARLLREQLAEARRQATPQQESGEPKREDFDDYESYLKADARWTAKQELAEFQKRNVAASSQQAAQTSEQARQQEVAQEWNKREKAVIAKIPDYLETVEPFVNDELGQFSDQARQSIVESGPQVLHYLATHPDDVERIAKLSPLRQAIEIGKLEDKTKVPAARTVSKAPAPITPAPQGRNAAPGYSENMSDQEYREWRKSQGATWAR